MRRMVSFRSPIIVVALLFLLFRALDSRGSDLSSALLVLGVLAAVALLAAATISWRNRRQDLRSRTAHMKEARRELRGRLDDMANDILRLEEQVETSNDKTARAHFRDASVAYASILKDIDETDDTRELSRLTTRLDTAIWNLDAAEAVVAGRPLPPKSRPMFTPSPPGEAERASHTTKAAALDVGTALSENRNADPRRRSGRRRHRSRHC
ncbi:MAG: hypothetical protein GWP04_02215 [Gammaproteobacteria bacterium]|nr:hypothetical protein [Gammaproteobacteria bacterium]